MDAAARRGHLDVAKYLQVNRSEGCTTDAMNHAAANGHLHVVRWLKANRTDGCTTAAVGYGLRSCHTSVFAFLLEHHIKGGTAAAADVVLANSRTVTDLLQYRAGGRLDATAHDVLKESSDVEIVHLLLKNRRELIDMERVRAQAV